MCSQARSFIKTEAAGVLEDPNEKFYKLGRVIFYANMKNFIHIEKYIPRNISDYVK